MIKKTLLASAISLLAMHAQASTAIGGGATLTEKFFDEFPSWWEYTGTGSGTGKGAFFANDATLFNAARVADGKSAYPAGTSVDFAGSDSVVTTSGTGNELTAYNASQRAQFGNLIQAPIALTSVTIPYNSAISGTGSLELTSDQLARIFAGEYSSWAELGYNDVPVKVVYRSGGSGTTEIFTRHLKTVSPTVVPGVISNNFETTFPGAAGSSQYIAVSGSAAVASAVYATPGAIGYVGPDYTDEFEASKVAAIENQNNPGTFLLPTEVNVAASAGSVNPPVNATAAAQPASWGRLFPNPSAGYPIAGFTYFISSQCYADSTKQANLKQFLTDLSSGALDAVVTSHDLIPLPNNWKTAISTYFVDAANSHDLSIGDAEGCAGKSGR